jgi:phosphatidylglycerophosphate synthase
MSYRDHVHEIFSIPGWLSLSRVALAGLFPFFVGQPAMALGIVAAAAISDMLDGFVARRLGIATPVGAALDPITDKIFTTSVMVSMLVSGRLSVLLALLLSARELIELPLLVVLIRSRPARRARAARMKANLIGKAATVLQFATLCAALFGSAFVAWWAIATAACGTVAAASYWRSLLRAWRDIRRHEPDKSCKTKHELTH